MESNLIEMELFFDYWQTIHVISAVIIVAFLAYFLHEGLNFSDED